MSDKIWFAEKNYIIEYEERIANATNEQIKMADDMFNGQDVPEIYEIDGDVARIKINGALTRQGLSPLARFFGYTGTGYNQIHSALDDIEQNPSVKEIRLELNTPGGEVNGIDEVWQQLFAMRKDRKIIAENRGLMASGGYYIASAANERIATSPNAGTGSIGVIITGTDWSEAEKRWGVKEVVITSKNAPKKYTDIGTKAGQAILQDRVDALERVFYQRISEGVGVTNEHIAEHFGKGSVLIAQDPEKDQPDALKAGMIDKVVSLFDAKQSGDRDDILVVENTPTPEAGKTNETEVSVMTLAELLAANAGAQAEYDKVIEAAKADGVKSGRESVLAEQKLNAEKVKPFIKADSKYGDAVRLVAVDVALGVKSVDRLEDVVTVIDAQKELDNSADAQDETDEQPENGEITGNADAGKLTEEQKAEQEFQANSKRFRESRMKGRY
jgi:ClpP class serine protease